MGNITVTVLIICFFVLIIHLIETLSYAVRIAGVKVKMIASAISMFSVLVLVSRVSNMIQQPFAGSLIDNAPPEQAMQILEEQFRFIIAGATIGTLIGAFMFPTFVSLFSAGITQLKQTKGSVIKLAWNNFNGRQIKKMVNHIKKPKTNHLKENKRAVFLNKLFITNMVITSVYTIGILSALYASLIVPQYASTAIMSSGLINGIATILFVLFVDPKLSVIADKSQSDIDAYTELKQSSITLVYSRVAGTIVGQIIFIPAAYYVAWMATLFN